MVRHRHAPVPRTALQCLGLTESMLHSLCVFRGWRAVCKLPRPVSKKLKFSSLRKDCSAIFPHLFLPTCTHHNTAVHPSCHASTSPRSYLQYSSTAKKCDNSLLQFTVTCNSPQLQLNAQTQFSIEQLLRPFFTLLSKLLSLFCLSSFLYDISKSSPRAF